MLKEKVRNLPSTPGVYLMKDIEDRIIYVGKAKNLKRRVQSYFHQSNNHPQKIKKMVSNLKDFDYILTDTEFEAFMLECQLIKEIKPLFNKKMKSSDSYVYIVIHTDERLHRIEITNSPINKYSNICFGPFVSRHLVQKAVDTIKESYQILCSNPSNKNTACLNYSLNLCIGMCLGGLAIEKHNKIIENVISLLKGADLKLIEELEQKMAAAAEQLDYKTAAKLRDQIEDITYLLEKEKVIEFTEKNKNIVMIEFLNETTFKLFLIKRFNILYSEKFSREHTSLMQLWTIIRSVFKDSVSSISVELSKDKIDESQIIYNYLENSQSHYIVIPDCWLNGTPSSMEKELSKLLFSKDNSPQGLT